MIYFRYHVYFSLSIRYRNYLNDHYVRIWSPGYVSTLHENFSVREFFSIYYKYTFHIFFLLHMKLIILFGEITACVYLICPLFEHWCRHIQGLLWSNYPVSTQVKTVHKHNTFAPALKEIVIYFIRIVCIYVLLKSKD
jgi:hypothetical protein